MAGTTIPDAVSAEIERTEALIRERDDALAIPRESAEFLHGLVLAGGFRRGLEVGMSYGYSGLWLGAAFAHNGGSLSTIERSKRKVGHARETFRRAGIGDAVHIVPGVAATVLEELHGPFDFVFLDADKENTQRYFEIVWPKLAHSATIVTDNVRSHADELREFVQHVRRHAQCFSTLVDIGSGLELTVKVEPYARRASVDGADWVI